MPSHPRTWEFVLATAAVLALGVLLIVTLSSTPPPATLPSPDADNEFINPGAAVTINVGDYTIVSNEVLHQRVATNADPLRLPRVAHLLPAEELPYRCDGQPFQAARTSLDAVRFGNEISRGGVSTHRLVGVVCEANRRAPLAQLLPSLSPEEARFTRV
jgi:hypothetical protein